MTTKKTNRITANLYARFMLVISLMAALGLSVLAGPAAAITRTEVLTRANTWVKKRVKYSQSSYYSGYRRDCSGFVSMAWGLKKSYSSSTISSRAKRVSIHNLKPGDAVLKPGHVSIFGGWKNKAKRQYYALEQTTWGSTAKKHVIKMPRNAKGLRRKGIEEPLTLAAAPAPTQTPATGNVLASIAITSPLLATN